MTFHQSKNQIKRALQHIFLLVALWSCSGFAHAQQRTNFQEVSYRQISRAGDFPAKTIYSLLQDQEGWIWLGTEAGLFRYDGIRFIAYKSAKARQPDLHNLRIGPEGKLYAQNFRGQLFCVRSDSLQLVGDFEGIHPQFTSFAFAADRLLVAAKLEIRSYPIDEAGWPLTTQSPFERYSPARASRLMPVQTRGALLDHFDPRVTTEPLLPQEPHHIREPQRVLNVNTQGDSTWAILGTAIGDRLVLEVKSYANDRPGELIFETELALSTKGRGTITAQRTQNGDFLFGGVNGLFLFEKSIDNEAQYINLLPGKTVNSLLIDRTGNVWVGTNNQGLLLIPDLGVRQQEFSEIQAPIVGLAVTGKVETLLGLTSNGAVYTLQKEVKQLAASGSSNRFWESDQGEIFIGRTEVYPNTAPGFRDNLNIDLGSVKEGLQLPDGSIALATSARVPILSPFGKTKLKAQNSALKAFGLKYYVQSTLEGEAAFTGLELRSRRATGIAFDSLRKSLYVAYNDSLLKYRIGDSIPISISQEWIGGKAAVLHCKDDKLFIGLASLGLVVLDLVTEEVKAYLPGISIDRIRSAGPYIWLQTNRGLYRGEIVDSTLDFEHVDNRMGLPSGTLTSFYATTQYAYAVYDRKVIRIPAGQQAVKAIAQPVGLENIKVAGLELTNNEQSLVSIEANRQSLSFEPRVPDYSQSPTVSFEYRLAGVDSVWQTTSGDNSEVFFRMLPEGLNNLQVRLRDAPQTINTLKISARVPFWRKLWPYVLLTGLIANIIVYLIRRRAIEKQHFAEREAALRESQLSALSAQMNPHFIFNALNSVQDFMLSNDRIAANNYLSKFAHLIRLTLEHSRNTEISLAQELDVIETYLELERIRFDDEIDIEFIKANDLPLETLIPPLVVQPYIENAFKHGLLHRRGERKLLVAYELESPDVLRITVEDNGVGRERSTALYKANSTSNGFATGATARRLALLNQMQPGRFKIEIIDLRNGEESIGTKVILRLHLNESVNSHHQQ